MENNILELLGELKKRMSYEKMARLLSDDRTFTVSAYTIRLWLKNQKIPSLDYESHLRFRITELKSKGLI